MALKQLGAQTTLWQQPGAQSSNQLYDSNQVLKVPRN